MRRKLISLVSGLFVAVGLAACGDSDQIGEGNGAELSTNPSTQVTFTTIEMGSSQTQTVELRNTGSGVLNIRSLKIEESDGDGQKEFRKGQNWLDNGTNIEPGSSKMISVEYHPVNKNAGDGTLVINSNALNSDNGITELTLDAPALQPQIFSKSSISFRRVPPGEKDWQLTEVRNAGQAPLKIDDIVLDGSDNFRITFPDPEAEENIPDTDLEEAPTKTLAPQESFQIRVWFEPDSNQPEQGQLFLYSNDSDQSTYEVDLTGNSGSACISVSFGDKVDFGQSSIGQPSRKTGTIQNCSEGSDLKISNIELTKNDGGVFQIPQESLPGQLPDGEVVIPSGERVNFVVTFTPEANQSYKGELTIKNTSPANPTMKLPVEGKGTNNECPKAVAQGTVGESGRPSTDLTTIPLETVQLSAEESRDPDGSINRYEWSIIDKPEDSTTRLTPNNSTKNPELFLDLQGEYKVELKVYDNQGQASCGDRAIVTIKAIPQDDIHVQLTWDTPSDPDETNDCGADLDLHYLHPNGKWKHPKWDIFFQNMTADWGEPGVEADNPTLDIDDTNGAGPENVNHSSPESGLNYQVGVYYYRSKARSRFGGAACPSNEPDQYGASYATIRIFIDGELQFEKKNKYMSGEGAFWNVAVIQWPSGNITPRNETSEGYPNTAGVGGMF